MENYFIENFEKFWPDHSIIFLGLDFQVIFKILFSDKLKNKNQHTVWQIIHNWIEVDTFNRLTYFKLLFKNCLQCDQLTAQFFKDTIFQSNVLRLLPLVFQKELKSFVSKNKQHLLVCINKYGSVEFYDAQCSSWHLSSSISVQLPNRHKYFQLALLDSVLYAFGGMTNNSTATNQMWRWSRDLSDPSQSQWTPRAPMKQSRNRFSSVVLNDTIYALGGWDKNFYPLRNCERYDSQLNQWSVDVAPMNRRRRSASAAVINGCIYIAGGLSENEEPLRSVEKYDPQTDTWREVAPMTTQRWVFALTPFSGRLWAIGGLCYKTQPMSSCESYDPVTDTWQKEEPLKSWRCQHAAIEFNGGLYVVGGKRNYDSTVVKYVPAIGWVNDGNIKKEYNDPHLLVIPHAYSPNFITFS